ncbi:hypothetical protein BG005_005835 [Podila minutissima]|nr:hypothetical protein BG005_005835 [Podila minutissima]
MDSRAADNEKYRNAEWGPEANQELIDEARGYQRTFKDFREQRYKHVKFQFERSKVNGKLIYGQVIPKK